MATTLVIRRSVHCTLCNWAKGLKADEQPPEKCPACAGSPSSGWAHPVPVGKPASAALQ